MNLATSQAAHEVDGAAGFVADVVKEEAPPEVNFLTVWHYL